MPAPATINEFLEVARRSNQVDLSRLEAYLDAPRETPLPKEPRKLAQLLVRHGLMTLFQAEQFLQGKYKGFMLGGYRIIERLGQGGTGTVYLAEHEIMRRRVAIKVLPTPLAEDRELLERFVREAQAAAALDNPNVVHVYDFRKEGPLHFIVMEYVDGPSLQQMISRRGPLPISLACEYGRQIAVGLQHAHDSGMVHRDIKPANLLVDPNGIVKVLDLGLARYETPGSGSLTQRFNSKLVLGTADYLAPEQALNLSNVNPRTDIYSLGATLYALLAGKPPFHEASVGQKLMWHQMKTPESLRTVRPEVPPELDALVMQMLAKRPADRPQTSMEVAERLSPWAEQQPRPDVRMGHSSLELGRQTGQTGRTASQVIPLPMPSRVGETQAHARDDTDAIELEEKNRTRTSTVVAPIPDMAAPQGGAWVRLLLLISLVSLLAGLTGGVIAFLLWGPRVG
ncbi:MAG: serine/threonine-protein kinase [Gemmataceae bacterium]